MHLLAAIPNAGPYVEYSIEGPDYYPWQDGLFDAAARGDRRPAWRPRAGPGWGVEVNPRWLAAAAHRETRAE